MFQWFCEADALMLIWNYRPDIRKNYKMKNLLTLLKQIKWKQAQNEPQQTIIIILIYVDPGRVPFISLF